jgi:phosphatidylethanolamine/phosphatidyl-N-methylethanolamine N-methyltransferase
MGRLIDPKETAKTRPRYNRIAPIYDLMEVLAERRFAPWRHKLWSLIPGGRVLEVGVGTGKNFPYHPVGAEVAGIDLSDRMLAKAHQEVEKLGHSMELHEMDAHRIPVTQIE